MTTDAERLANINRGSWSQLIALAGEFATERDAEKERADKAVVEYERSESARQVALKGALKLIAERDALRARIADVWDEGHLVGYDGPGFEEFEKSRSRNPYRRADQPEAALERPPISDVLGIETPDDCPNADHPALGRCGLCGFIRAERAPEPPQRPHGAEALHEAGEAAVEFIESLPMSEPPPASTWVCPDCGGNHWAGSGQPLMSRCVRCGYVRTSSK